MNQSASLSVMLVDCDHWSHSATKSGNTG